MTTSTASRRASLAAMSRIEARRFARHPLFLVGAAFALGLTVYLPLAAPGNVPSDLLSWQVLPAFFVGLPSLVVAARLTRSTESSLEAVSATPGTEARRTLALAAACVVPCAVGALWVAEILLVAWIWPPAPQEWWLSNVDDLHVLAVLVAGGPVACLGGGLLGVLTGRWLRFPGAPAVVLLSVLVGTLLGQAPVETSHPVLRMWTPWVSFQSGTDDDGTQVLYAGNAVLYVGYALCLCAAAVLVAVWHDRAARSRRLVALFVAVVAAGLACLGLAMTTGVDTQVSEPIPAKVQS